MREKPPEDPTVDQHPDKLAGLSFKESASETRAPLPPQMGTIRPGPVGTRPVAHRPPAESKAPASPTATTRPVTRPSTHSQREPAPILNTPEQALEDALDERDEARKMVAAREGILQVVAHDLRNPLNLVKVGGSLLTRMVNAHGVAIAAGGDARIEADRVRQVADTLAIAVRRMERLITDLLDLEALDKGSLRLVRGPANANHMIEEILIEMRPKAADKGCEIVGDIPRHTVIIDCDKDRIAQILENLIGNAIRFTPSGKTITLRLKEQGPEARFEVADEGPGIADGDLPRIFDPYFRAEVPQGRGLGLGLSISLGLVRAHDGAIWAESAEGHGATFVFTMPRRDIARDTMVEFPAIQMPLPARKGR